MNYLKKLKEWLIEEGVDFKDNIHPLYHVTSSLRNILKEDILKISSFVSRGPIGICLTRSKLYGLDGNLGNIYNYRIILDRDLLLKDGYRSYPLDEWALKKNPKNRTEWVEKDSIKRKNFSKSNFDKITNGPRYTPNGEGILKNKDQTSTLEVEFEERILKDIKNLHKYIYGINILSLEKDEYKKDIMEYIQKYPYIKIYTGKFFLKEVSKDDYYHLKNLE